MSIIMPLIFIAAIAGMVFLVIRKKSPETADKIWAAVAAGAAVVAGWFGGLFDKIGS